MTPSSTENRAVLTLGRRVLPSRRGFLCLAILIMQLALGSVAALADPADADARMKLTGQSLEYDEASRIVLLRDGAYLEFGDMKLWADNVHGDLRQNMVYAEGNVILWRGEERLAADALSYNIKTRRGSASNMKTMRGPAIIRARRIRMEPYRILGWDVSTTTDPRDVPGYRIVADRMVMLPRDRVVFRDARFKIGESTIFKVPRYMINLANAERVNRLSVKPSWNPGKGFFLRSTWDYYFSDAFYGRLYFNPSQFQGTDLGLNVMYAISPTSGGRFDFVRFNSTIINQLFSRYDLRHKQNLGAGTDLDLQLLLAENEFTTGGTQRNLTINSHLAKTFPDWTTALDYNKLLDLNSGLPAGGDLVQYANATPKFTFSQNRPVDLFDSSLAMRMDGSVSKIDERTFDLGASQDVFSQAGITNRQAPSREVSTSRSEMNFAFSPRPLTLGQVSRVNYSFRDSQVVYGTGDLRNFFSLLVNTNETWGKNFSTGFDYVFQNVGGTSPFATFDRLEPDRHLVTSYIRTQNDSWFNATLFQTQFDIHDDSFRSASSNFTFRSAPKSERQWALALTPIYDFNNRSDFSSLRLNTVSSNLRLAHNDQWATNLIVNYDSLDSRIESVSNYFDVLIGETVRAEVASNASFNSFNNQFDLTKLNLALTKDLNAWEARVKWNTLQKEVFLEFYLKFAASKRLSLGLNYASDDYQFISPNRMTGQFP